MTSDPMHAEIVRILVDHGRMPVDPARLGDETDLYQSGLTSHASVNVMLALEDAFDVEFPDAMLRKSTFQSVAAIRDVLTSLGATAPVS